MAINIIEKPFSLLGYRFMRGMFDEALPRKEVDLDLVVAPSNPEISKHVVNSRKVIEITITIAIVKRGTFAEEAKYDSKLFGQNTIIAVKYVAGYVAKEEANDGDLIKFNEIVQLTYEPLYQVVRAKLMAMAADSGFDSSDVPTELDLLAFQNELERQKTASPSKVKKARQKE